MDRLFSPNASFEAKRTNLPPKKIQLMKSSVRIDVISPFIEMIAAITPLKTSPRPPHLLGHP